MNRKLIFALLLIVAVFVMLPEASASKNYQPMGSAINHMGMDDQGQCNRGRET